MKEYTSYTLIYSTLLGEIKKTTVVASSKDDLETIMRDYDWEFEKIISIEYES